MKRRILTLMMSAALIAGTQSTVWADVEDYSDGDVHTIGGDGNVCGLLP